MAVYDIHEDAGYRGCGKAWAAVNEENVVIKIQYMDGGVPYAPTEGLEPWQIAALDNVGKRSGKAKEAAIAAGHPGVGPRGGYVGESTIVRRAEEAQARVKAALFGDYRKKCREDLSKKGRLISGMCSCRQFVTY